MSVGVLQDNLVLSTGLIIGHHKEIQRLMFRALAGFIGRERIQFTLSTQLIKPNYLTMNIMLGHFTSTVLSSTSTVTLRSWSFVVLPNFLHSKGSPHMRRKRDVFPTPVLPHKTTLYVLAISQSEFSIN